MTNSHTHLRTLSRSLSLSLTRTHTHTAEWVPSSMTSTNDKDDTEEALEDKLGSAFDRMRKTVQDTESFRVLYMMMYLYDDVSISGALSDDVSI